MKARVEDLQTDMLDGQMSFTCHKTNQYDDDSGEGIETENSQHCAGALILLEKLERPNQMMRWMERIGVYNRTKLDMDAPVFDSFEDMIEVQE